MGDSVRMAISSSGDRGEQCHLVPGHHWIPPERLPEVHRAQRLRRKLGRCRTGSAERCDNIADRRRGREGQFLVLHAEEFGVAREVAKADSERGHLLESSGIA
jgi:hypothetical protein